MVRVNKAGRKAAAHICFTVFGIINSAARHTLMELLRRRLTYDGLTPKERKLVKEMADDLWDIGETLRKLGWRLDK